MAQKQIVWSALAELDFKATLAYYHNRDGDKTHSQQVANSVLGTVVKLKRNNHLGKETSLDQVRVLTIGQLTLLYQIMEEELYILTVYDPSIPPEDLYAWS